MGSSISLSWCRDEAMKPRGVLVIKEDGESLEFKDGTLVKDVLAAYPYHKIIRCCSERTVIPGTSQLNSTWLYLLLPEGLALSDGAYHSLMRSAATKKAKAASASRVEARREGNEPSNCRQDDMVEADYYDMRWKPVLKTIPELPSPSV